MVKGVLPDKLLLHSTETALLKIHMDIRASMDACKDIALTLLNLSMAFDTMDITILLRRLDDWFLGLPGRYSTGLNHIWLVNARGLG